MQDYEVKWWNRFVEGNTAYWNGMKTTIGKRRNVKKVEREILERAQEVVRPSKIKAIDFSSPEKLTGFVYLMWSGNGLYKIGISKGVQNRLHGLRRQFPIRIEVIHFIKSTNYKNVEKYLHNKFASKRAEFEWFRLSREDVLWIKSLKDFELDDFVK